MATYQLTYFNTRGLAEASRIMFALANVEYEDKRYPIDTTTFARPEFDADAKNNAFEVNMGRVPILTINGKTQIGQSRSIDRFVAKQFGFFGSNDIEGAHIDMIGEHTRDIAQKYFDARAGKKDAELATAKENFVHNELPQWLAKLEKTLHGDGFAVGNKLSLADIYIYRVVYELFDDKAGARKAAEPNPRIIAIADKVAVLAKDWIEKRPATLF